ncbi:MAG: hypothetical protein M0T84_12135 [Betaproteobacteria bacterium]|nr:hypothetical protein [Betaproteobacteria bacterium]
MHTIKAQTTLPPATASLLAASRLFAQASYSDSATPTRAQNIITPETALKAAPSAKAERITRGRQATGW